MSGGPAGRVPDPLLERVAQAPRAPALRAASAAWDRRQLAEASERVARSLADAGVGEGSRVAVLAEDDAPSVAVFHAVRRLGATLMPLNRRLVAAELRLRLELGQADVLLVDAANAALAHACAPDTVPVERLEASLGLADDDGAHEAAPLPGPAGPAPLREGIDPTATAVIVFTSGTSGRPRGVMLSHDAMRASAHAWADRLRPVNGAHWLACLPLYHVAGLAIVVRATRWGSLLEVMSRFDADAVDAAIDRGVTHTSLVPTQLEALLDARGSRAVPPTLRAVLIGGGPAPSALLTRARVGGWPVITTYGMTETGSGVAAGAVASGPEAGGLEPDRDSGLLRTLSGVSLRIEPDGESDGGGEILVAGEMLYSGYLGEPEATAERLRDGWFHTGDIGRLEADGRFRVLDRRDDLIISGGENISPAEVEAVLASYPGIRETAVVGLPDPRWGAVPVAAVVATIEVLDESALARHCRARLAPYKVPTRFVMVERLPRNELGKLLRRAVRERLAHAVDEAERARPTRETGP